MWVCFFCHFLESLLDAWWLVVTYHTCITVVLNLSSKLQRRVKEFVVQLARQHSFLPFLTMPPPRWPGQCLCYWSQSAETLPCLSDFPAACLCPAAAPADFQSDRRGREKQEIQVNDIISKPEQCSELVLKLDFKITKVFEDLQSTQAMSCSQFEMCCFYFRGKKTLKTVRHFRRDGKI